MKKQLYTGIQIENGTSITGQLLIIGECCFITDESEINKHSFYAVNPESFIEVIPESVNKV